MKTKSRKTNLRTGSAILTVGLILAGLIGLAYLAQNTTDSQAYVEQDPGVKVAPGAYQPTGHFFIPPNYRSLKKIPLWSPFPVCQATLNTARMNLIKSDEYLKAFREARDEETSQIAEGLALGILEGYLNCLERENQPILNALLRAELITDVAPAPLYGLFLPSSSPYSKCQTLLDDAQRRLQRSSEFTRLYQQLITSEFNTEFPEKKYVGIPLAHHSVNALAAEIFQDYNACVKQQQDSPEPAQPLSVLPPPLDIRVVNQSKCPYSDCQFDLDRSKAALKLNPNKTLVADFMALEGNFGAHYEAWQKLQQQTATNLQRAKTMLTRFWAKWIYDIQDRGLRFLISVDTAKLVQYVTKHPMMEVAGYYYCLTEHDLPFQRNYQQKLLSLRR